MDKTVVIDWNAFGREELTNMYYESMKLPYGESDIYGWIYVKTEELTIIIDVCFDKWSYDDRGITLEVYIENENGCHSKWLGGIRQFMKSARNYKRFQNKAESAIKEFVAHLDLREIKTA